MTHESLGHSLWRYTGSPGTLDYHTLGQDVNLTKGALVRQRLKFQWYNTLDEDFQSRKGNWNKHYLE